MRYVGSGIGHLSQHSEIIDSNVMDVDADMDTAHDDDVHGGGQQVQQLEQLAHDVVHHHSEHQVESNNAGLADDVEDSSDTSRV